MPRSNSTGSPRGRKTSSTSRTSATGKGGPRKASDKPFKRSAKPAGDRPYRAASGEGRGFKKSSSDRPYKKDDASPGARSARPYKKFDADKPTKRPYKKDDSFSEARGKRPYKKAGENEGKRPFKKDDSFSRESRGTRPYKKFDSDAAPRRSYKKDDASGDARGERPYKKFDKDTPAKRTYKKDDSFSGAARGERSFKKFDKDAPAKRSYKKDDSAGESRGDRPYKKFDREAGASKTFFGKRGDSDFERPSSREESSDRPKRPIEKFDKSKLVRKGTGTSKAPDLEAPVQTGKIRLNKYIANSGVCSRREADELITLGVISVNGKVVTELGYKVNPGDEVRHESKLLRAEKPVYILMNKPKGFLTTTADPQERNTVMHIIGNVVKERVYPVGRLDRNTTGLLLLTNDGDLADKLMHPSYNVKKIYKVELDRPLTKADAQTILEGVKLEEGRAMVDDLAIISEDKKTVGLEIHIGWNRVVRRIFESLEYQVVKLDRSVYAGLNKKELGRGEWRFLTKEELVLLKHYK